MYLFMKSLIVMLERIKADLERVIVGLENAVIAFQLLGFPTSSAVLEPHGNLSWLKTKLLGKLHFSLRLKLVLHLEILLQGLHLLNA